MPLPKPLSIMAGCPPFGADLRWCYTPGDSNQFSMLLHRNRGGDAQRVKELSSRVCKMYKAIFPKRTKNGLKPGFDLGM
jgi:hypothetical protein